MTDIQIEVLGLERIRAALARFPSQIAAYMGRAGLEAALAVKMTKGITPYPPSWAANQPPTPYYIRGRGTQTAHGNLGNSERYGSQWEVKGVPYGARLSNSASYAKYLAGDEQVSWAGSVGWKKLADAAREKRDKIVGIFQSYINRLIKDLGL